MASPLVSVIIPVYNDESRLSRCLECLDKQSCQKERFEILVVDNGSDVSVRPIVDAFSNAKYLYEPTPGSYAARNLGVAAAKGEILAFTDSDCLPDTHWIENGAAAIAALGKPGLVVGEIAVFFQHPKNPTWVELYEREFAFPQKENAKIRHYGATANVFASKGVFDTVGSFNGALKSGGDREWGNRAFAAGFPLRFDETVKVLHPARRRARAYFAKLKRTAHGHYALRHNPDNADLFNVSKIARRFIPPLKALTRIGQSGVQLSSREKAKVACFVIASQYYSNLVRLKLTLFGHGENAPRQ